MRRKDPAELFGLMTTAQREALVRLYERRKPFRIGSPAEFDDHAQRQSFYDLGLLSAVFPDAKPGDSGLQHWMLNVRGYQVLGYALHWRDQRRPLRQAQGERVR